MFTRIRLKNFRSFDHIEFDLSKRNGAPKPLSVVYGENGAGKSNLTSAFVLLNELMQTMDVRDLYEEILNQDIFKDEKLSSELRQRILSSFRDIQAIINDYRMVGCNDPIYVEYEFFISGKPGLYSIELGAHEIIREHLEFVLNKRRGTYIDFSKDSMFINPGIVNNTDLLSDLRTTAKKYWGKHSFLAIIMHELRDKAESYGKDNISSNFDALLEQFYMISCNLGIGDRRWNKLKAPNEIFEDPDHGELPKESEYQLDIASCIFTRIFSSINSSIRRAYYKRKYNDSKVSYQLFFEKKVAGCYRDIAFSKESTGNHQIISILCYMLCACLGQTVVLDEADSGIHDYLFYKILQDIYPHISGQIIMTTHNTFLMQANFARESTYIIKETEDGCKEIRCVSGYEKRTYLNNNIKNKYLGNEYGGLPNVKQIDFDSLLEETKDLFCG